MESWRPTRPSPPCFQEAAPAGVARQPESSGGFFLPPCPLACMENGSPSRDPQQQQQPQPPFPLLGGTERPEVEAEVATSGGLAWHSSRGVLCLYAVGFLDFFGVSMIVPLLSLHVKSLGASPTIAGVVGSLYGILQLLSSTLVGSWSDIVGRPYCLLVCILFSALGYFVLSVSTSIFLFAVARIIVGIFKHTHSVLKVVISDVVPERERLLVLGHFNAVSSTGFILGPVVGGYLTELEGGFFLTALICASIFIFNAGLVRMLLWCEKKNYGNGRTTTYNAKGVFSAEVKQSPQLPFLPHNTMKCNLPTESPWTQFAPVLKRLSSIAKSDLWDLSLVRLLMSIAVMLYHSNFILALEERFGIKPKFTSYLISYSSTLGVAAGFLLGPITRLYQHQTYAILLRSSIVTCVFIGLYSLSASVWIVVLSSTILSFSTTVGRTCLTNLELALGGNEASGMLIGVGQSVSAVGRIVSPLLSGIAQEFSPCGPSMLGGLLGLMAVVIMILNKSQYSGIEGSRKLKRS